MTAPVRFNHRAAFLMRAQAVYGTAETLSATADACNPFTGDGEPAAPDPYGYVFDGAIGRGAAQVLPTRRIAPNGRFREFQFQALVKGRGSAYSASVFPPNEIHRPLLAAGYEATFSATPSARIIYTPIAPDTQGTVLTVEQYAQGAIFPARDVVCNFSYEAQGTGVPIFTFPMRGVAHVLCSDASFPSITLDAPTVNPPAAVLVVSSLGAFTGHILRNVSFDRNRAIETARYGQNVAGVHAGFVPSGYNPTMTIEIERPARSGYDPEAIREAASVASISYQVNSTGQFNRFTHVLPNAQLVSVTPGNDGPIPTVTLVYEGKASSPTANDAESLTFD